jgi:hypothetical protein
MLGNDTTGFCNLTQSDGNEVMNPMTLTSNRGKLQSPAPTQNFPLSMNRDNIGGARLFQSGNNMNQARFLMTQQTPVRDYLSNQGT